MVARIVVGIGSALEIRKYQMPRFVRMCLVVLLGFAAIAPGSECPKGDLSGDCAIGFDDVWTLAQHWLNPAGSQGDIIGSDGVNMGDFAALAENWGKSGAAVVINELNFDHDVKTDPLEFVELHNRTTEDVNISNWYFRSGITYQFPANTTLPAGGYIAVAQNPDRIRAKYGAYSWLVYGPWAGKLSNSGERVELCDADGNQIDQVDYQLGFPWPTVGDSVPDAEPPNGSGHSIQLVNPYIDNDLGGSWRSGFPTPTGSNFIVYLDNPPPHMRQVNHSPKEPVGGEDVTITVKVTDPLNKFAVQSYKIDVTDLVVYTEDMNIEYDEDGDDQIIDYPVKVTPMDGYDIVAGNIEITYDKRIFTVVSIDTAGSVIAGASLAKDNQYITFSGKRQGFRAIFNTFIVDLA